jgi:hypothetical protein
MPREASGLATLCSGTRGKAHNDARKKTGGVTPPHVVREMTPPCVLPAGAV